MSKKVFIFSLLALFISVFSSCEKETDKPYSPPLGRYESGVFIINEGNYNQGNGSISFYSPATNSMNQNIFQTENNRSLGDVVQSMSIIGDYGFIAVNNSNKIEVVNYKTFLEQAVINDLPMVRYIQESYNDKAYVSCWGDEGQIKVIDTKNFSLSASIAVGNGPEGMFLEGDKLFVANSGGLLVDNTISVINVTNNTLMETIEVAYSPKKFVKDTHGMLWVLCSGTGSWSSVGVQPSKLMQIDPVTFDILQEITLFEDLQPSNIAIDKTGTIMVIGGGLGLDGLYKVSVNYPQMPVDVFVNKPFYGFSVDPNSSEIWAADAGDFTNKGNVTRYSFLGELFEEYEVGIIPNGAAF